MAELHTIIDLLNLDMGMEYFGRPMESGNNIMVKCPFHKGGQERRPSMGIRIDTGIYHCFTCDVSGDLPTLIAKCLGLGEKRDANGEVVVPAKIELGFKWLLDKFNLAVQGERPNIPLDFDREKKTYTNFISPEEIQEYKTWWHPYMEDERKITDRVSNYLDIGYDNAVGAVVFPIYDIKGNCVYLKRRPISSYNEVRYVNVKDVPKKHLMFGAWQIHRDKNLRAKEPIIQLAEEHGVFVVEGEIDVCSYFTLGRLSCCIGGRILFEQQARVLSRMGIKKIVLSLDNDEEGMKETKRIKEQYSSLFRLYYVKYPSWAKDANDLLKEGKGLESIKIT